MMRAILRVRYSLKTLHCQILKSFNCLTLPLFVAAVCADHPDHTLAANDLAVLAKLLN
jgi:hypothetical protein